MEFNIFHPDYMSWADRIADEVRYEGIDSTDVLHVMGAMEKLGFTLVPPAKGMP